VLRWHNIGGRLLSPGRFSVELPTLDKFPKEVLAGIDIQRAFIVSRLIISAERLQVFRLLHGRRLKAEAVGEALKIHSSYCSGFLDALVAIRLLRKAKDTYWSAPLAEKYFVAERSIYWTRQYSKECVQAYEALTLLETTLASGKRRPSPSTTKKPSYVEAMKRDPGRAEDFTQMLFHFHKSDAEALAKWLDLSNRRAVLDVGGGSGVMSIALAKKNPHLQAVVMDIAPVCRVAEGNIRRAGLSKRIRTLPGDIRGSLPEGFDVILICDIGVVTKTLLTNAFQSLPSNGSIVLVDRYLSNDRTQPLDRVVAQFVGSSFPLTTAAEMKEAVKSCGFRYVKASKVYRVLWFITGVKPRLLAAR
jgi:predicted nicotinamide N-methyase